MSNPTPIYTEALREAKRRTRKGSPERATLVAMDERTAPKSGPVLHFTPPVVPVGPDDSPGKLVHDLQQMGMI